MPAQWHPFAWIRAKELFPQRPVPPRQRGVRVGICHRTRRIAQMARPEDADAPQLLRGAWVQANDKCSERQWCLDQACPLNQTKVETWFDEPGPFRYEESVLTRFWTLGRRWNTWLMQKPLPPAS